MSAQDHIDRLDASLAKYGETIVLIREIAGEAQDVTVRARTRNNLLNAGELAPGVLKSPETVIITLTQIRAAGWPQGAPPASSAPYNVDPAIPVEGDLAIIKGRPRTVRGVNAIAVDDVVVRVEFLAEG